LNNDKKIISLNELNNDMREFMYIVSHDLKAPVRGIKQASDWLLADYKDKLDNEGQMLLFIIQDKAKLLSDMMESINHFSKVNFSNNKLGEVNLDNILDMISINLKKLPNIVDNKITIVIKKEFDKNIKIISEELKFYQILFNLFLNIINFTGEDQKEITCTLQSLPEETNKYFILKLMCETTKLDNSRLTKLFEPFQEIMIQNKKVNTMMTLALTKKLIESFSGEIKVTLTDEKHLIFSIFYPIKIFT
jgi:light-regulated signal transduction histidine kinase (bacteriophytochrome)